MFNMSSCTLDAFMITHKSTGALAIVHFVLEGPCWLASLISQPASRPVWPQRHLFRLEDNDGQGVHAYAGSRHEMARSMQGAVVVTIPRGQVYVISKQY